MRKCKNLNVFLYHGICLNLLHTFLKEVKMQTVIINYINENLPFVMKY